MINRILLVGPSSSDTHSNKRSDLEESERWCKEQTVLWAIQLQLMNPSRFVNVWISIKFTQNHDCTYCIQQELDACEGLYLLFWRLFSNYYYWKWVNNDILACNCYWSQTSVSVKKKEKSRPWQDLFVTTTRCRREIIQEKKKILWMWDIQVMLHPQVFFNVIGPKEIWKSSQGCQRMIN